MSLNKPKGPWYKHFDFWTETAYKYLHAYRRILLLSGKKHPLSAKYNAEFQMFYFLMGVRLIFESNLVEGAGLSKEETKKVID